MKKYLFRGLLFAIPFIVYFLFILIIDPHNFFNVFHVINDVDKKAIISRNDESSPRGNMLWKSLKIKRNPVKKMIIGDSQAANVNVALIEEICGEKYFNYSIPGPALKRFLICSGLQPAKQSLRKFISRLPS